MKMINLSDKLKKQLVKRFFLHLKSVESQQIEISALNNLLGLHLNYSKSLWIHIKMFSDLLAVHTEKSIWFSFMLV